MASFRVHFIVPDPHGPIFSGQTGQPPLRLGTGLRYRAACDPKITLSETDRASGEPWACYCNACKKTDTYKQALAERPHPQVVPGGHDYAETEDNPVGVQSAIKGGVAITGPK